MVIAAGRKRIAMVDKINVHALYTCNTFVDLQVMIVEEANNPERTKTILLINGMSYIIIMYMEHVQFSYLKPFT